MKRPILCLVAAVVALAVPAAARAEFPQFPDGPVQLFLKDHPALVLSWTEDGLVLDDGEDHWGFQAQTAFAEAGPDLLAATGRFVHAPTGECLTVDEAAAPPVDPGLADCADATVWHVLADTRRAHEDLRIATDRGFRLGTSGHAAEAGDAVRLVRASGKHDEEWRFRFEPPVDVPESPEEEPPPAVPDTSTPPPAEAQPRLPATGAASAASVAAGAGALAAGAAALLWVRRRSLPGRR